VNGISYQENIMVDKESGRKSRRVLVAVMIAFLAVVVSVSHAQKANSDEEFDTYKLRVSAFMFYSNPAGDVQGSHDADMIDLEKDFNFNSYSTFTGKADWKFTHKNHFYLVGSDFNQTRQVVLKRTITFQGQTFNAGAAVKAQLDAPEIAPGYQYDIIRRKRGHLGVGIQVDLFDTSASISAAAQVTGDGTQQAAATASGSLLAPIPVAGPDFRFYLTNSPRLLWRGR
jgi:hypothetical protein